MWVLLIYKVKSWGVFFELQCLNLNSVDLHVCVDLDSIDWQC